jgi:hypothetical protein
LRRHSEARARVAHPSAPGLSRGLHREPDLGIGRKARVEDAVSYQLAHYQPDVLKLLGRRDPRADLRRDVPLG